MGRGFLDFPAWEPSFGMESVFVGGGDLRGGCCWFEGALPKLFRFFGCFFGDRMELFTIGLSGLGLRRGFELVKTMGD